MERNPHTESPLSSGNSISDSFEILLLGVRDFFSFRPITSSQVFLIGIDPPFFSMATAVASFVQDSPDMLVLEDVNHPQVTFGLWKFIKVEVAMNGGVTLRNARCQGRI